MYIKKLPSLLLLLLLISSESMAKKPDWGGSGGSGIIGFGIVELTPKKEGDSYIATEFVFNYDIDAAYSENLLNGQVIVIPAKAFEDYNDIPASALMAHASSENLIKGKDFHMSIKIKADKPGLYIVAYGPYTGMLFFDDLPEGSRETYKISGESKTGGQLRWIDQDAGDITVMNYKKAGIENKEPLVIRIRLLRDKASILENKDAFKYETFKLNPKAEKRVRLLDANW